MNEPSDSSAAGIANEVDLKSVKTAYLLWVVAGAFGAHRWYVGRWATAFAYFAVLMLVLTGGLVLELFALLGIALVVDAFLIPRMVRVRNEALLEEFRAHPERFARPDREDVAPWAHARPGIGYKLATPVRVCVFLFLPALAASMAVQYETYELVIIPIVILIATGLISTLDQIVVRYPALSEIPGLDAALARIQEMRQHFWDNEPRVGQSFVRIFTRAFGEYRPYWKIVGLVVFAVAVETVLSFRENYPPYLGIAAAAEAFAVLAISITIGVLIVLIPITNLSFRYSLSGMKTRLRILTVGALVMTGLGIVGAVQLERDDDAPSLMSDLRLEMRMGSANFREDMKKKLEAFLTYYSYFESDNYTKQLRESLAGIAKNDEIDAFEFLFGDTFIAAAYKSDDGPCELWVEDPNASLEDNSGQAQGTLVPYYLLSVADHEGVVYHDFASLPPDIRMEFESLVEAGLPVECHRLIDSFEDRPPGGE